VEASGQKWANPDITSSAKVMKNLAKSTQKAKKTVLAPIKKLFLPNTIGTNYKKRLDFIFTYFKETLI
jgi:hypothetical protein